MSEREADQVEERWRFRFAPEHRTLLGAGLPTGSRSRPDRRDGAPEDLAEKSAWPVEGVLIIHYGTDLLNGRRVDRHGA